MYLWGRVQECEKIGKIGKYYLAFQGRPSLCSRYVRKVGDNHVALLYMCIQYSRHSIAGLYMCIQYSSAVL
jgi:hypothetical protein